MPDPDTTYRDAVTILARMGVSLTRTHGEYRVTLRLASDGRKLSSSRREDIACYETDLHAALDTADAMLREQAAGRVSATVPEHFARLCGRSV